MVKTKASLLALVTLLFAGCAAGGRLVQLPVQSLVLSRGAQPRTLSLALQGRTLVAVYSDSVTTTLQSIEMPTGARLPPLAPAPSIIDKVDVAPPLSPTFGAHSLAVNDGTVAVLYLDRRGVDRQVLKLASRQLGSRQWLLEIIEPAGDPIAVLPDAAGNVRVLWASAILRSMPFPNGPVESLAPFTLEGRASTAGPGAFTAFDAGSKSLASFRSNATAWQQRLIPGAGPLHASTLTSAGRLAVLCWDPDARRLRLLEEKGTEGSASISRETVTLSEQTSQVALLALPEDRGFLALYDEARNLGSGRLRFDVCLIAPGLSLGTGGARYRKAVLLSGDEPVQGLAAVSDGRALYVMVQQGSLRILRVPLSR
jgi:hypothetical protein